MDLAVTRTISLGETRAREQSLREIVKHTYYWAMAAAAMALLYFVPPHFDVSLPILITVAIVAAFLIVVEKPEGVGSTRFSPLTAILTASIAVLGWWALVLSASTWIAIRSRLYKERGKTNPALFATGFAGQLGTAIISVYCAIGAYGVVISWQHFLPPAFGSAFVFLAVMVAGLLGQTVNNASVGITYLIVGRRVSITPFTRVGIVASIWAYFLVAIYTFGGLIATAAFYFVVAGTRAMDRLVGVTRELEKVDLAQAHAQQVASRAEAQAKPLLEALIHLDRETNVEFIKDVHYLTTLLGRRLGLAKEEIEVIGQAATLHEIGKSQLPEAVRSAGINLERGLRCAEYPTLGGALLRAADTLVPAAVTDIVVHHGEAYDGSGYPHSLRGERIPLGARLIAIARGYVALLSGREDGGPVPREKALETMRSRAGTLYDPALVELLCNSVR